MTPLHVVAFTRDGAELARLIAARLGGRAWAPPRYAGGDVLPLTGSIAAWTREYFPVSDALVFVSACGIAVRAVAPCLKDKTRDPAVVCLDDRGRNVISLLSGHLGGANELARRVAELTRGRAAITTATDVHEVRAVDVWAKEHDCAIENIGAVKSVSAAALDGEKIGVAVTEMEQPAPWPVTLWLRPRNLVIGVGCKRGTTSEALHAALDDFLSGAGVSKLSICALASIDLKKDEPGLTELARGLGVPFLTFTAAELAAVPGRFSCSERVLDVTGVDNVCERAAVLASGGGPLLRGKTRYPGITFALARRRVFDHTKKSNLSMNDTHIPDTEANA